MAAPSACAFVYSHEGGTFWRCAGNRGRHRHRLPLLTGPPFWLVAGDVFMPGFDFPAADAQRFAASSAWRTSTWCESAAHPKGTLHQRWRAGLSQADEKFT